MSNHARFQSLPRRSSSEVAIPLDEINKASARRKSIRHGHPRPCTCGGHGDRWRRHAQFYLPSLSMTRRGSTAKRNWSEAAGQRRDHQKRNELFQLIGQLVQWENTNNEDLLKKKRCAEIWESWRETCEANKHHPDAKTLFDPAKLPGFHDPFAGGGAIPLEAQRLGLIKPPAT